MRIGIRITGPAIMAAVLLGCGGPPGPDAATPMATQPAIVVEPDTASAKDFGDYVVYFNALRTDELTPEVARSFGIVRSANRAMVNVSLIRKVDGTTGAPAAATVRVTARNLANQDKGITVREIREGEAIYYIGDVPVINEETLVVSVEAVPAGETRTLALQFKRQFYTN